MYRLGLLFAVLLLGQGCVAFTPAQRSQVSDALVLAQRATDHPAFGAVLLSMEESSQIDWSEGRREAAERAGQGGSTIAWLIGQYDRRGQFDMDSVHAWVPKNPFLLGTTVAQVPTGSSSADLNVYLMDRTTRRSHRDVIDIANTLLHERVHTFGLVHGRDQTRPTNRCDASYVAGDLAEALLRFEAAGSALPASDLPTPVCEALLAQLRTRGMILS